jgi:hypothetical protein
MPSPQQQRGEARSGLPSRRGLSSSHTVIPVGASSAVRAPPDSPLLMINPLRRHTGRNVARDTVEA